MKPSSPKQKTQPLELEWRRIGRRLRDLRGFDMTQQQFADRLGISQTYVSEREHGNVEIGATILIRIAREFDKTIEWLLTGEDRPKT